jgi:hypothetical protein
MYTYVYLCIYIGNPFDVLKTRMMTAEGKVQPSMMQAANNLYKQQVYIHLCAYICLQTYICINIYRYLYVYIYINMCICLHIYEYICI